MAKVIYLVTASRGDYSDRTEYPVCWFASKTDADSCAVTMEQKSNECRARAANSEQPWNVVEEAAKDIGDSSWSYYDCTDYRVCELERGTARKAQP